MGPLGIRMLNRCAYMYLATLSVDQAITTRLGRARLQKRKHWSYPVGEGFPFYLSFVPLIVKPINHRSEPLSF